MEEQNQNQFSIYGDHYEVKIKEEDPDPYFSEQGPFIKTVIKEEHNVTDMEENPDPDLLDQNSYKVEIKEEYLDFYTTDLKEENQDVELPDTMQIKEENQDPDPDHGSRDPAGSSDQQVSESVRGASRGLVYSGSFSSLDRCPAKK